MTDCITIEDLRHSASKLSIGDLQHSESKLLPHKVEVNDAGSPSQNRLFRKTRKICLCEENELGIEKEGKVEKKRERDIERRDSHRERDKWT